MLEFKQHTLKNGLQIVAECNDLAHSTSVGFFVQTGSRDETDELAGVSHFLEHMAFKGTARRSADDVNREFDEIGAFYNAFTSEENTVYYAAVLPEFQEKSIDILADIMRPSLRQEDFDTEKKVIIEEIRMYDDQPPYGADDRLKAIYFGSHPLSRSVLGTVESVTALTAEAMREYFQRRYSPGNLFVAGAGRIDFDALVAQVERLCGDWTATESGRKSPPAVAHGGLEVVQKEMATQQYVLQLAAAPSSTDEDRFAAKLLATIVGDDSGSRLYWDLVDSGQAEHASMGHYEYQGTGVYMAYLSGDPASTADNLARMEDVFRQVEAEGISEDELQQARSKVKARVVLGSERPRNRLFNVGGNWASRQTYRSIADDLASLDAITREGIHAVLAKHPLSKATTVTVGPLSELK